MVEIWSIFLMISHKLVFMENISSSGYGKKL